MTKRFQTIKKKVDVMQLQWSILELFLKLVFVLGQLSLQQNPSAE